jgi:murein DD-endopeptidase MepM/ murein hydrolase activator NlpD
MRPVVALGTLVATVLAMASIAAAQDTPVIPPGVTRTITWAESHGRECHRVHGRPMCEGPRRVPAPTADDAARATELGITSGAARRVLLERPREAWIAAAGAPAPDLAWPVDGGRVWRGFGIHAGIAVGRGGHLRRTRRRQPHEGVDIGAPAGTAIFAANEGLVVYSDNGMTGYGNAILIVHADASVTLYGHCTATFVVAGQHVARGEIIATVGDTGLAHGAHLHFEVHVDGHAVDPAPRFVAPPGPPAAAAEVPETSVELDPP